MGKTQVNSLPEKVISKEIVLVLDYGSQYNQLIVRRLRECGVWSELLPYNTPVENIIKINPKGIILSGGPASVYAKGAPFLSQAILDSGIPILGICYGMQLLAHNLGGKVNQGKIREYGATHLEVLNNSSLFHGINNGISSGFYGAHNVMWPQDKTRENGNTVCWMSHGDEVVSLPDGFSVLAKSEKIPVAAIGNMERRIFGVQFHPEVTHTSFGTILLKNFLKICNCKCDWTASNFIEESILKIRSIVGKGRVIAAISGGVDSTVACALVNKAVGSQLTCLFVDNGLLRKGEVEEVISICSETGLLIKVIDAQSRFLLKLKNVVDPEEKRIRIGNEFISVFEEEASKLVLEEETSIDFLVQGTLYPDVVESKGVNESGALIKTHHNVGGLPSKMKLKLIEPFRYLFKDEVREIGKLLGLPKRLIERQPFPGPGLAVRILGEVTSERLEILRTADAIVREECEACGITKNLWQYFAVLLPVKTVGVMGDERSYEHTIAIRTVTSCDGMTADWGKVPLDVLGHISNRIVNEIKGVNRVVYDLTSKPPGTIEWE